MSSSTESSRSCEFEGNIEALRQVSFFAKMPLGFVKSVAFGCDRKTFRAEAEVFSQGDMDDRAYSIVSGRAELIHAAPDGEHVVGTYGPGSFLGGLALLGDAKRLFTLRVVDDLSVILVGRGKVQTELAKNPELMTRFLAAVTHTVVKWEEGLVARSGGCEDCIEQLGVSLL